MKIVIMKISNRKRYVWSIRKWYVMKRINEIIKWKSNKKILIILAITNTIMNEAIKIMVINDNNDENNNEIIINANNDNSILIMKIMPIMIILWIMTKS